MAQGRLSRLRRPGWLVLGGTVLLALAWLGLPRLARGLDFFRLRRIEFVGVRYLRPRTLLAELDLPADASVFDDLAPIRAAVQAVPGVQEVSVGRRLPGTVRVRVREARPVALVAESKGMSLIDAHGEVLPFDPAATAPDLPVLARPDTLVTGLLGRLRDLDPSLFGRTSAAWRSGGDVVLQVNETRVWFRPDATAEAIAAVTAVAEDLAARGTTWIELDARYRGQIVVRGARPGAGA